MASIPTQFGSRILNLVKNYGVETLVYGNIALAHIWFFNFLHSDTADIMLDGQPKPFIKEYELMRDKEKRDALFSSVKERVKNRLVKDLEDIGIPALWNIIRPVTVEAVEAEE